MSLDTRIHDNAGQCFLAMEDGEGKSLNSDVRCSKVNLHWLIMHALNCVRSTACCIKRYFVGWLSVVACWTSVMVRAGAREWVICTFFFLWLFIRVVNTFGIQSR